ncbi:MAG: apolipoprotein N-acyltransferase, partial [Proteobacteria bacterium]|nr:apolipoprotein N-acyltransferase [Pseudomonadota bacterium]
IQPPISLFPLAYVSLIPLIHSLKGNNIRHNFLMGFITGVVSHIGHIYWVVIAMNRYGGIDIYTSILIMLLLVLYISLYIGCFTASSSYLESKLSIPLFLSAPFIWVLLEYIRGVFLTGFPWSFLAHSQHNFLTLIQVVSITGTYFLSFLIVAINFILYRLFIMLYQRKTKGPRVQGFKDSSETSAGETLEPSTPVSLAPSTPRSLEPSFIVYAVIILAFFIASCIYGYNRLQATETGRLKAVIIQGNIRQDVKWGESFKVRTIKTYLQKSGEAGRNADIVIWPETAMPFVFDDEIHINRFIKEVPIALQTNLLFGTVSKDKSGRYRNSAYVYGNDGMPAGNYSKVHLVPFGEYTPLISYFPFLLKLTAAGGDFAPGESHKPIATPLGKIGILICYEGAFPSITIETVRKGAQVLVNLTNDAWYDKSSAPYQHLVFYVFRAVEADRYVLRAANTGISTIIDPRGRIKEQTGLFVESTFTGMFSLKTEKTPYVTYGDYFILFSFLCLLVICVLKLLILLRLRGI